MMLCSFSEKEADAMLEKAYAAEDASEFEKAIGIYNKVLETLPADSLTWASDIYASLLNCHFRLGQNEKALMCGEKSLHIDEKMGDKERICSSLGNLAAVLISANRTDEAENYLLRSITISRETGNEASLAIRLGMLAELYVKEKQSEKALPLAKEALDLDTKGGREAKAAIRMSQYGNALVCLKRPAEALPYLNKALALHKKYNNLPSQAITLVTLGMAHHDLGHREEAKACLNTCITLAKNTGIVQPLMTAYLELSQQYNEENDPRAYGYLVKYNELKDSLTSKQVQQQISDFEVKYATKEKQQELERKELLIQRQRLVYIGLAVVLMLTIAVTVFLVKLVRLKNQSLRFKDRVLQILSHDLKNPALAQQQGLHLLSRSLDSLPKEEVHQLTVQMAEDADAQVNLLYSMLDWARLQTGHLRYTPISHSLCEITENVIGYLRAQASVKNITLTVNADCGNHTIYADRQMVGSMIRNLVSNAIKFSDAGSEIRINISDNSIVIDDDGIGIGKGHSEQGTGLGLKIVETMAKINKADFTISSKPNKGTRAVVRF